MLFVYVAKTKRIRGSTNCAQSAGWIEEVDVISERREGESLYIYSFYSILFANSIVMGLLVDWLLHLQSNRMRFMYFT